jgi:hypothetical protein
VLFVKKKKLISAEKMPEGCQSLLTPSKKFARGLPISFDTDMYKSARGLPLISDIFPKVLLYSEESKMQS